MIITKLRGGLGNQMFQYAIGRNLALANNTYLRFDLTELKQDKLRNYKLNIFNISGCISSRFEMMFIDRFNGKIIYRILKILGKPSFYIKQKNRYFDANIIRMKGNIYLDGYWQCELYFKDIRSTLLNEFTVKHDHNKGNKSMLEKIENTNSVCIHIRRNDYITNEETNSFHGICSLDYYFNAVRTIEKRIENPYFYVFSDDPKWTKQSLKLKHPVIYIDINSIGKCYDDLILMSKCKHFIIANSSFSWWGAWLSNNPRKIVCAPNKWFVSEDEGNIVPKTWLRIKG